MMATNNAYELGLQLEAARDYADYLCIGKASFADYQAAKDQVRSKKAELLALLESRGHLPKNKSATFDMRSV